MTKLYGSLEAGGTKFVCAVGDENFNVVEKTQFPTTTPIETIDKTIEFFSKFDNLAGLAVGSFGPIDIDKNSKTYAFIQQAGIWGPPLFIFLQILQTVVPIIPGALTSVAGVFIYGHIIGTIYNYIGIVIGCAIIFYLVRLYGAAFVQSVVSKRTYDKYIGWLDKGNRFDRFFIFMMIWPISPADFLCMLAALTKMSFKRYMTIIILTKPFTLVVYTYGLTYIIDFFWQML